MPRQTNFVHEHVLILPDSERAVSSLVFHSRIPPPVEMDHVRGGGEVKPGAAGFERKHEERDVFVLLELLHQIFSLLDRGPAMEDEAD